MKKFLILAAFMLAAVCLKAQDFEVGGCVQYGRDFDHEKNNVGADIRATFEVAEWAQVRAIVDVNVFVPNYFDRYGKAMIGLQCGWPFAYVFADYGANYNRSATNNKIGLAADVGIGTGYRIGNWRPFAEVAMDAANNGRLWQNNLAVKCGVVRKICSE